MATSADMSASPCSSPPPLPANGWQKAGVVIAAGNLLCAIVSLSYVIFIKSATSTIENSVLASEIMIDIPKNGSIVPQQSQVRGHGIFPHRNNYILVSPENGTHYIYDITLSPGNQWTSTSNVTFGEGSSCGVSYLIQIIGTDDNLQPGVLKAVPGDDLMSRGVTVARENCP